LKFTHLDLPGVFLIHLEPTTDSRGSFTRTYCQHEFKKHGIHKHFTQSNLSYNRKKGTLRGLHYQTSPYEEAKLIRCTKGKIFDVIVDLKTHKWISLELQNDMLYIPEGYAHGFQTLEDNTEVFYQMTAPYSQNHAQGLAWNDPKLSIEWPLKNPIISERDQQW